MKVRIAMVFDAVFAALCFVVMVLSLFSSRLDSNLKVGLAVIAFGTGILMVKRVQHYYAQIQKARKAGQSSP